MARVQPITPTRRILMQSIMWIILGATVGLAAIVSHVRRTALETRLSPPMTWRGVSVRLPAGWNITKGADLQSSLLLTATESSKKQEEDEQPDHPRVIRIVRQPLGSFRAPLEYAGSRLSGKGALGFPQEQIVIDGSPAAIIYQMRVIPPRTLEELVSSGRLSQGKTICAATVAPSGRGIAVEYDGEGRVEPHEIALVKQIAESIKLQDEPPVVEASQVQIGPIGVPVPTGFLHQKLDDPLMTAVHLRGKGTDGPLRSITLLPIVMLPNDSGTTLLTMLSLYDPISFEDAVARQDDGGAWRIENDRARGRLPIRAAAISKNGPGILAILRGGEDDAWMEPAWQAMREKLAFSEESKVEALVTAGAEEVQRLRSAGLSKFLPESHEDLWWLYCVSTPDRPFAWSHYTPGERSGRFENRYLFDRALVQVNYAWTQDSKSYGVKATHTLQDLRDNEPGRAEVRGMSATFNAANDRVSLAPRGNPNGTRPINYAAPDNYLPGGWLMALLGRLSERPLIVRTESLPDCAYAQPLDLLTVTIRPETIARNSDEAAAGLKCVSFEASGSGERYRFYFRPDGTLDRADCPQSVRMIRRDKSELDIDFSQHKQMVDDN